jgi:hypothetical protein
MTRRADPGECPICGAAHTACTGDGGPIVVVQLPATAAARARLKAEGVQAALPSRKFTTGTYRRGGRPTAP